MRFIWGPPNFRRKINKKCVFQLSIKRKYTLKDLFLKGNASSDPSYKKGYFQGSFEKKNVTIRTLYKINVDIFEEIKSVPRDRLIASKDAFDKHGDL